MAFSFSALRSMWQTIFVNDAPADSLQPSVDLQTREDLLDTLEETFADIADSISNIDNTSDANKPVSTAQATAIAAAIAALTKASVGLSNVDNTSDANKPISTVQAAVNNLKAALAGPVFTGAPKAPTPTFGTSDTQIANMAALAAAIAAVPSPGLPSTVSISSVENGNSNTLTLAKAVNKVVFTDNTNPIINLPTDTYIGQSVYAFVQGNGRIGDPFGVIFIYQSYGDAGGASLNVYNGDAFKFTRMATADSSVVYLAENISLSQTLPYLAYSARLSQTSTSVPTRVVSGNTLRNVLNYARTGVGVYTGTFNGGYALFIAQKTFFPNRQMVLTTDGAVIKSVKYSRVSDTVLQIETFANGVAADGVLDDTSFEVRVYREYDYS
jgi:hypothetical protein